MKGQFTTSIKALGIAATLLGAILIGSTGSVQTAAAASTAPPQPQSIIENQARETCEWSLSFGVSADVTRYVGLVTCQKSVQAIDYTMRIDFTSDGVSAASNLASIAGSCAGSTCSAEATAPFVGTGYYQAQFCYSILRGNGQQFCHLSTFYGS
ncbi:MAG TPA: hypothetical protein VJM51_04130 [Dehalococcoidia bacterium]|nr:hypothetical protein [Dehalococcoidia bacterium]